jgi:Fic family protein
MSIINRTGKYQECSVAGEKYKVYLPNFLPPVPAVKLDKLYPLIDKANHLLGQLESMSRILPDHNLFLYMYVRKEAVLSSQIEGTQSSLSDLLKFENNKQAAAGDEDVTEVSNYVAAMEYGLKSVSDGFPLCLRLLREMHEILLRQGRGSVKMPGEFRRSQNWIGGTRPGNAHFVPPAPEMLANLLTNFEKFIHDDSLPVLVKAALLHVQFETIHPFLDGNGRLGRLLITLILCNDTLLTKPLLYLSLYFKTYRAVYYEHLQSVRETGDWEAWLEFFLEGVVATAQQSISTMQAVETLFQQDKAKIYNLGKACASTMKAYCYLQQHPITDAKTISKNCELTLPTALKALASLQELGIITEVSGRVRNKVFQYSCYLNILEEVEIA